MFTGILQPTHMIILLAVVLLLFGPKRLPDAGRALGQGLREFKTSLAHDDEPALQDASIAQQAATPVEPDQPASVQ
jgi:sec-independent protein translocase protein TatA